MKPSWESAPDWAQWLAQNEDGSWQWFENPPQASWSAEGRAEEAIGTLEYWIAYRESRP
jgi:hypothetical protein